jgi:hypothetical protein
VPHADKCVEFAEFADLNAALQQENARRLSLCTSAAKSVKIGEETAGPQLPRAAIIATVPVSGVAATPTTDKPYRCSWRLRWTSAKALKKS